MNKNSAKKSWHDAKTFDDLCALTADFISGKLPYSPTYGESVETETSPLVGHLMTLNKNGFMTDSSQPGEIGDGWKQRAFVYGYAQKDTALKIATLTLFTDLYVGVFSPKAYAGAMIPVTVADNQPFTWAGFCYGDETLEPFVETCNESAISVLLQAWHVSVIDLVWGRKDHLWNELVKVLTADSPYSVKPHPDLGPDDRDIFTF